MLSKITNISLLTLLTVMYLASISFHMASSKQNMLGNISDWTKTLFLEFTDQIAKTRLIEETKVLFIGSELAQLGGLAHLGEISSFLFIYLKNLSVFIWELSQPA